MTERPEESHPPAPGSHTVTLDEAFKRRDEAFKRMDEALKRMDAAEQRVMNSLSNLREDLYQINRKSVESTYVESTYNVRPWGPKEPRLFIDDSGEPYMEGPFGLPIGR